MLLQFLFRSTYRKRILPKEDIVLLILRSRFLPGNVVIIASTLCPRLRPLPATPTNVFLGGLATADLVLIIFCIPVKVSNKTRDLAGSCFSVEVLFAGTTSAASVAQIITAQWWFFIHDLMIFQHPPNAFSILRLLAIYYRNSRSYCAGRLLFFQLFKIFSSRANFKNWETFSDISFNPKLTEKIFDTL